MATASTPTTEPPKQWLEDQKREFDGLVRRLNVDSDTQKHAWGLLVSYYEKESGNIHTSVRPSPPAFSSFWLPLPLPK
jgi:hypothetical protein